MEGMQSQQSQESFEKVSNVCRQTNILRFSQHNDRWSKDNLPFQGGYEKFKAIKKSDRKKENAIRSKARQLQGEAPFIYAKEFPSFGTFTFRSYNLHYNCIEQSQSPKAIIIYLHGSDRHSGEAGFVASVLTEKNPELNFYAFDQMNFGKSEGPYRGEVACFEDTINQLDTFVSFVLKRLKSRPKIFLSGSSYGGSVVFKSTLINPKKYSGLVLFCPALKDNSDMLWFKKKFSFCAQCLLPRIRCAKIKRTATKYNQFQRIEKDPLNNIDGILLGTIANAHHAMLEIQPSFEAFEAPYIIFQGGYDKIVNPFGPLDLEERCRSRDKTTVYCEKMWHDAMNEEEIEDIAWMAGEWLKERI